MKRITTVLLASTLALALTFSPVLAYAAEIDFDNIDDTGASGYSVENGYIVTTGDAQNTIMGNGTNYALNFTHAAAEAVVQGDVVVGEGITAEGSLELTGTADDSLTVISNLEPAIEVQDELEISGGLEVTATSSNVEVTLPGISAGTFTLTEGKVIATGSASHDGVPSRGIQAHEFNIGNHTYTQDTFDKGFYKNMTTLDGAKGCAILAIKKNSENEAQIHSSTFAGMSPYHLMVYLGIMPADVDLTSLVTKGQFAQYLYLFVNGGIDNNAIEYADYETAFTDIEDSPYKNYIKALESMGILRAEGSKEYKAQTTISGLEISRCALLVMGYDGDKEKLFNDENWAANALNLARRAGAFQGIDSVDLAQAFSHAELAQLLSNMLYASAVTYRDGVAEFTSQTLYNRFF